MSRRMKHLDCEEQMSVFYDAIKINRDFDNSTLNDVNTEAITEPDLEDTIDKQRIAVNLGDRAIHMLSAINGYCGISKVKSMRDNYSIVNRLNENFTEEDIAKRNASINYKRDKADYELYIASGARVLVDSGYDSKFIDSEFDKLARDFEFKITGPENSEKRRMMRGNFNHQESMANDPEYRDKYLKKAKREFDKYCK